MDYRFKNDYLDIFKQELQHRMPNKNTRKNYIYEINKAFKTQEFSDIKDLNYNKLQEYTENLTGKRSASTLKCALKLFSQMFSDFNYRENERFLKSQVKTKNLTRKTKWQPFKLSTSLRKINSLSDIKLKLGFRTMFAAGLRVEELSNIKKRDLEFQDNKLYVFVERGKHGKSRLVEAIDDNYLSKALHKYLQDFNNDDYLFHNSDYIIHKAAKNNFKSHDLRRAFSKIIYNSIYKRNVKGSRQQAIDEVIKRLGHEDKSTTYKKYLSRKVDFSNTKWDW